VFDDNVMGCCFSSQNNDNNLVKGEENPTKDETKEEKEIPPLSEDHSKIPKKSHSLNKRKSSKHEDQSFSRENSSTSKKSYNGNGVETKRSFIDRISHFRKSKRASMQTLDKSISCSMDLTLEPSQEEVESWAIPNNGFENMMSSPAGREIFLKFLKKEFSSENLAFWTACEELRKVKDEKIFGEKVEEMFTTFMEPSSPQEVSLDFKVKEKVMDQREQPSEAMFDEAQSKIYTLMHRDSFPRFLTSSFYKKLQPEDVTDSKDNNNPKQEPNLEDTESEPNPANVITITVDTSENDKIVADQPNKMNDKPTSVTEETSKGPVHQDSLLDPKVVREHSKDSPNSFRTVTLDSEYDKLLNLIE